MIQAPVISRLEELEQDAIANQSNNYRWEQKTLASWQTVIEDEHGNITAVAADKDRSYRSKRQRITTSIRRGLIRYLVVGLDWSDSALLEKDFRPCRLEASINSVKEFLRDYFDQNPISLLSIVYTRDRGAGKLSDMSTSIKNHDNELNQIMPKYIGNTSAIKYNLASLQQLLIIAMRQLKHVPNYGHKEVLFLFASLNTCDDDIFTTIKEVKKAKIRVNIISLCAEIYICKHVCELTGGIYSIAIDEKHLHELVKQHVIPPPEIADVNYSSTAEILYIGFPEKTFDNAPSFGFDGNQQKLFSSAYICPQCYTRTSEIPSNCAVCRLPLHSSAQLARSTHHLFPVQNFIEMDIIINNTTNKLSATRIIDKSDLNVVSFNNSVELNQLFCYGCLSLYENGDTTFRCPKCFNFFCMECDLYIHDNLHHCPGCSA